MAFAVQLCLTLAVAWTAAAVAATWGFGSLRGAPQAIPSLAIAWRWGALVVLVVCWRQSSLASAAWLLLLGWVVPTLVPFVLQVPTSPVTDVTEGAHTFALVSADIGAALACSVAAILLERPHFPDA